MTKKENDLNPTSIILVALALLILVILAIILSLPRQNQETKEEQDNITSSAFPILGEGIDSCDNREICIVGCFMFYEGLKFNDEIISASNAKKYLEECQYNCEWNVLFIDENITCQYYG